jgi:hypothetical protein
MKCSADPFNGNIDNVNKLHNMLSGPSEASVLLLWPGSGNLRINIMNQKLNLFFE